MAKRKSYNPLLKSYPDSERVNAVSEGAELLYVRLVAASDDAGRYYGEPEWVLAKLFTHRMIRNGLDTDTLRSRIEELWKVDLVRMYEVDGTKYLQMVDCYKQLRSDVAAQLVYPEPLTEPVPYSSRGRNGSDTFTGHQPNPTQPTPTQPSSCAASTAADVNDDLRDWLEWWNALKADSLVAAGVDADKPSQGVLAGWNRVKKSKQLREMLNDRDAIRREVQASTLLREPWFRLEKLFGGKNRDGEYIIQKVLDGGFRDRERPKPNEVTLPKLGGANND